MRLRVDVRDYSSLPEWGRAKVHHWIERNGLSDRHIHAVELADESGTVIVESFACDRMGTRHALRDCDCLIGVDGEPQMHREAVPVDAPPPFHLSMWSVVE